MRLVCNHKNKLFLLGILTLYSHLFTSCKTSNRSTQNLNSISVEIKNDQLVAEQRELLPVLYCELRNVFNSYEGRLSKPPHKKFEFDLQGESPLTGREDCSINLYSEDVKGIQLLDPENKVIDGSEYKILYTSNYVKNKNSIFNFQFERLYQVPVKNILVSRISFTFDKNLGGKGYQFYCNETKLLSPVAVAGKLLVFEIFTLELIAKTDKLTGCVLKDLSSEAILDTNITEVTKIKPKLDFTAISKDLNNFDLQPFEKIVGKSYRQETNGCIRIYEFSKKDEQPAYSFSLRSDGSCSLEPYEQLNQSIAVFSSHEQLEGILNENKFLVRFTSNDEVTTYKIFELNENKLIMYGGNVSKVELLRNLTSGLVFDQI